jgi:uncharacterized protein (DUF2252 family)
VRWLLSSVFLVSALACDSPGPDTREAEIVEVMVRADQTILRSRPRLAAGKYLKMTSSPFAFLRGTLPVFRHDWERGTAGISTSRFTMSVPLVAALGDAHVENFGTLRASDGTFALEPNDFDSADQMPYLWDVRRLAVSLAVAAKAHPKVELQEAAETAARAAMRGYVGTIAQLAAGEPAERVTDARGNEILDDLFSRSTRDAGRRRELVVRTVLEEGARRLKRGAVDPEEPTNTYAEVPSHVAAAVPEAIARYRLTLIEPPPADFFRVLDVAREHGAGVASLARVRLIVLVRGPTDDPGDDVMLEIKELGDSLLGGHYPPGIPADDVLARVREASRAAWARPDAEPLWGTSTLLGLPVQIRQETEAFKGLRTARFVEEEFSLEGFVGLGEHLGAALARIHRARAVEIGRRLGADGEGFVDEQVAAALRYADLVMEDFARFKRVVERDPLLGVPRDESDRPPPDLEALFGEP